MSEKVEEKGRTIETPAREISLCAGARIVCHFLGEFYVLEHESGVRASRGHIDTKGDEAGSWKNREVQGGFINKVKAFGRTASKVRKVLP